MDSPSFPAAAVNAARDAAKVYLRSQGDAQDDAALAQFAATALMLAEVFTGRALIARTWHETLEPNTAWQALAAMPVVSIDAIEGVAADGITVALPVGGHALDIDAGAVGRVRLTAATDVRAIRVTYSAGMAAAWADLPAPVAQGITILAAHLFEARHADAVPPAAVSALWRPWRRLGLAA